MSRCRRAVGLRYVRHTEDIDLGMNVAICDLDALAEGIRSAGYEVVVREPDGQDPLGGVIDVSGPFGLIHASQAIRSTAAHSNRCLRPAGLRAGRGVSL